MKLRYAIPVGLGALGILACQANAIEPVRPNAPAVEVTAPGADVRVGRENGEKGVSVQTAPVAAGVNITTPNAGVDVRTPSAPTAARDNLPRDSRAQGETRPAGNLFADNRPDQWRYKWSNNRWWYWTPENRWMWYSEPGGWTYYEPASGSYTTGYGGVPVVPNTGYVAPPATTYYYYPSSGYYYGYPAYGYYGRPGFYIGGPRWGVGVGSRWR